MTEVLLLVLGVCTDSFATSVTYGTGSIKIKLSGALLISLIGAAVLAGSFLFSDLIGSRVNENIARIFGGAVLTLLGLSMMIHRPKAEKPHQKQKEFPKNKAFFAIKQIFSDETKADLDNSKELSVKEAALLGIALSADSFAAGASAGLGFSMIQRVLSVILTFAAGAFAILGGAKAGSALSLRLRNRLDLSVISGIFIAVLGISQIFRL